MHMHALLFACACVCVGWGGGKRWLGVVHGMTPDPKPAFLGQSAWAIPGTPRIHWPGEACCPAHPCDLCNSALFPGQRPAFQPMWLEPNTLRPCGFVWNLCKRALPSEPQFQAELIRDQGRAARAPIPGNPEIQLLDQKIKATAPE
jgi:hypothetical protein